MSERSKMVMVLLTPEQVEKLAKIQNATGASRSWLVRKAIQEMLAREEGGSHATQREKLVD